MKLVTFTLDFPFAENSRDTKTYPAGWRGLVEDDVAKAALKADALKGKPEAYVDEEAEAAAKAAAEAEAKAKAEAEAKAKAKADAEAAAKANQAPAK